MILKFELTVYIFAFVAGEILSASTGRKLTDAENIKLYRAIISTANLPDKFATVNQVRQYQIQGAKFDQLKDYPYVFKTTVITDAAYGIFVGRPADSKFVWGTTGKINGKPAFCFMIGNIFFIIINIIVL